MLPEMTPAVARALEAAQKWAARTAGKAITPEYLLYGLLDEEEGRAVLLLKDAGLDLRLVQQALAARNTGNPETSSPLPISSEVTRVLRAARHLAGETSGDRTLTSEQVLVALCSERTELRGMLSDWGVDLNRLEVALPTPEPPLSIDEPLSLGDATELVDVARILDAAANRAREALRVLEDHCRFALDDRLLSGECKTLRHDLAGILETLPLHDLLESRDTRRDVGTDLSTVREHQRYSIHAIVEANCKRLQEALRSLEEYGKLRGPDLGPAFEQLRYRSYTLERALMLGGSARERLADVALCVLLSVGSCRASLEWTIQEAAAGGAGMIQFRAKGLTDRELLEEARRIRRVTRQARVLFIVNDRPEIARLAEADGVHVGQDDLPVKEARRVVGPGALLGVSTHSLEQVGSAVLDGASYLGVGPVFPSRTKSFENLAGTDFVRAALAETSLPIFAIGGINQHTIADVAAAGAGRVAVSQAICEAEDPRRVAAELVGTLRARTA